MNISNRYKYLYFVTPKCASATLRISLKDYTDIGYPVSPYKQHMTMPEFVDSEHGSLMDEYFKFTFVRNPYDRLYSGFRQDQFASKNYPQWTNAKAHIFDKIGDDFNSYLLEYVAVADIKKSWDWICFTPMKEFSSVDGQYKLDWFGKAESFEADLCHLSEQLGIEISKSENKNVVVAPQAGLKYLSKYTRKAIEWVNQTYREDFEIFDYEMLDAFDFPERV